jgi:hypothetical protein
MSTVSSPQYEQPAIVTNRWVRNDKHPDAAFQNDLAEQTNHLMAWHTKEVFSYDCPIASIPAAGAGRDRWRFAWHSGPYARYLWMRVVMAPGGEGGAPPGVSLTVTNGAGSTIGTAEHYSGMSVSATDTPAYFSIGHSPLQSSGAIVAITADTDYFGLVSDVATGRVQSISVYEVSLEPTAANGYIPAVSGLGPIYDADRSAVATALRNMWKRGAAHLFNWSVDPQSAPRTTTSATEANLVDTALTGANAYGAAAPQWVLDVSNRTRVAGTGVPIVVKVYASRGTSDGTVYLVADSSDVIATVTITGAAAWYSATATIDPTLFGDPANASVHLTFKSAGGTCSVYAVSVYQYQA